MADREFFLAHRLRADLGLLVQLAARSQIDGKTYVSLSRRVTAPEGGFGGIVAGGLDLTYFAEIFSRFSLPPGSTLNLIDMNGHLVAGFQSRKDGAVRTAAVRPPNDKGGVILGTGREPAEADPVTTTRRLGNLPFMLSASTPRNAVLSEWRARAWATAGATLAFVGLSCALMVRLAGELGRRRQAEAAARAGEARITTYVDHLGDGLLAVRRDEDGRWIFERVNAAAAEMLGLDARAAIGLAARDVWPGPAGELAEEGWTDCLTMAEPLRYERVSERPGGRRVLRFVVTPVRDGSEPPTLLLASVRDVTATADLEEQLRQSQRMEAVGQLTAGVAHDFNNMLQAQTGALELLRRDVASMPQAMERLQLALEAAEHGGRLTHSLLSFSRQQLLAPRAIPVHGMLDGLRRLLASTLPSNIELDLSVHDGGLSPFADMAQLEAALLNLALNARDAMPWGGTLRIEARPGLPDEAPRDGDGAFFLLAVADTGTGMSPETAAKACEPFYSTKGVGRGSGLGLSMVQGFVQQSGGAMHITSEPGAGTRVELRLPQVDATAARDVSERTPRGKGTVLLVDDAPEVIAVTAELLEDAGFAVLRAGSAEDAMSLLGTACPVDILVTDFMMPGMNGGELVGKARDLRLGLPALVVTGYTEVELLRGLPADVRIVRKPLRCADLVQQLTEALAAGPCLTAGARNGGNASDDMALPETPAALTMAR